MIFLKKIIVFLILLGKFSYPIPKNYLNDFLVIIILIQPHLYDFIIFKNYFLLLINLFQAHLIGKLENY
jgi:hypothetical protein